jgi:hypothetical protein
MHNQSMIYGYARVSSNGEDLAQQLAQLGAAGCKKIYQEKVSGGTAERPQLKRAIDGLDAGDVLMVTSTDRLARNTRDLLNILHAVKRPAPASARSQSQWWTLRPSLRRSSLPCWVSRQATSAIGSTNAPLPAGPRPKPVA